MFLRKLGGGITPGLRAGSPAPVNRAGRRWLVAILAGAIMVAGLFLVLAALPLNAAPEDAQPLECSSCHTRVLKSHDKLGEGNQACWLCHDSIDIGKLRLFDGTKLPLENSSQLCGQCHPDRYQAWDKGQHGVLAGLRAESAVSGVQKLKCIDCHNPHEPKVALTAQNVPHELPTTATAAGQQAVLDCLSCHAKVLKVHDKLGEGSEACWACHYNMEMGVLHLAGGETQLPLSAYPVLCGQCHQERYRDWAEGTHGMPGWNVGNVEIHGVRQVGCIGCHEPHQPQVVLTGITRPHPLSAPPPPSPPVGPFLMLAVSLLIVTVIGVAVARQGAGP